jgi:hypothetical protein
MSSERGSTLSFVDLPVDIHLEIAQAIDHRIGFNPSSRHASDPEFMSESLGDNRPDQTLVGLSLVCKRLHRIYAPFSTWRTLLIEVNSPRTAQLEPSPSLSRLLVHPETGLYARELVIHWHYIEPGCQNRHRCLVDVFAHGNLVHFSRFLANTPRLETVRCTRGDGRRSRQGYYNASLPIEFFASLSSLPSLRYLYLEDFIMDFEISPSFPPLHQVRILRYSLSSGPTILGDLLRFSMPRVHTLYVSRSQLKDFKDVDDITTCIQVRRHFLPTNRRVSTLPSLSVPYDFLFRASICQTPPR